MFIGLAKKINRTHSMGLTTLKIIITLLMFCLYLLIMRNCIKSVSWNSRQEGNSNLLREFLF